MSIRWHAIPNDSGARDEYAIAGSVNGLDKYTVCKVCCRSVWHYETWRIDGTCLRRGLGTADEARAHAEALEHEHANLHAVQPRTPLTLSQQRCLEGV